MVFTSKVLGLTLLSALSLAAPFEDSSSSIAARNAEAIAEALLEFDDLEVRDAEAEAEADAEAYDLEESLLAEREALEEEFEFALAVSAVHTMIYHLTDMFQGP